MTKKKQRALPASYLDDFKQKVRKATAILYRQSRRGDMEAHGTVITFWQNDGLYYFLTASHCAVREEMSEKNLKLAEQQEWYICFDEPGEKLYIPAKIFFIGDKTYGNDSAVFTARLKEKISTIPLADEDLKVGEDVFCFEASDGIAISYTRGYVKVEKIERPLILSTQTDENGEKDDFVGVDINEINEGYMLWKGMCLLQMPINHGASGASIISPEQKAIGAILTGGFSEHTVAVPISIFKKFWLEYLKESLEENEIKKKDLAKKLRAQVRRKKKEV